MASACRSMPSGWSTAVSYGPRQPTARWQSRRRSWLTCSMVSIGAIRGTLGDRRPPAELRQVDSAAWRGGTLPPGFDSIGGVSSPAPLPNDLAEAHALILQQRQELAAAEARASGAAAMIAHLKLVIAKLRRDQYGQPAERGRKLLDQLELQLEELEADATERSVIAERDTSVQAFTRRRPVRAPLPAHLPRERVVIPAPCACPFCGGKLAKLGKDITETLEVVPRQWKVIQTVREKFTCRHCERITQPPAPFRPIARARAGERDRKSGVEGEGVDIGRVRCRCGEGDRGGAGEFYLPALRADHPAAGAVPPDCAGQSRRE